MFRKDGKYFAFGRYYMPEARVRLRGNEQLAAWVRDGWIRTTPGDVLDIEAVREELIGRTAQEGERKADGTLLKAGELITPGDVQNFEVQEVPFDPAQLTQFCTEMMAQGVKMVEMRPTVLNFSPAMKELDELVQGGKFVHNGDPVLSWAIANVVCHWDKKDNIYPNKESVDQKIDPAIALIMAIGRAMSVPEKAPEYKLLFV